MTETHRNGGGRSANVLMTLLVALVGLLGGVAASEISDKSPNRQEVVELIRAASPYAQDREFVRGNLVDNAAQIQGLDSKLDALQIQVARVEARLEELLGDAIILPDAGTNP